MKNLQIKIFHDEDGTCALQAKLHYEEFSGVGKAYFDTNSLRQAAKKFNEFPLSLTDPPLIEGGYFCDNTNKLSKVSLSIKIFRFDDKGGIVMAIILSNLVDSSADSFEATLNCSIPITYVQINEFARGVISLCDKQLLEFDLSL